MAMYIDDKDQRLTTDWRECRETIGRLDGILVDLRKFGFTIVTTLLTADALVGERVSSKSPWAAATAGIVVMILIDALFALDVHYQCLQDGAVERALDIEARTRPPVRITKYITLNVSFTHTGVVTTVLHMILVAVAALIGGMAMWPSGEWLVIVLLFIGAAINIVFIGWYGYRMKVCAVEVSALKYHWPERAEDKSEPLIGLGAAGERIIHYCETCSGLYDRNTFARPLRATRCDPDRRTCREIDGRPTASP